MSAVMPRYPVYVPSRHRSGTPYTIDFLRRDKVPFYVVVEQEEYDLYEQVAGAGRLLVLPESGKGLIYARNWIKAHSIALGAVRHWQLDDNMRSARCWYQGKRLRCDSGLALRVCEDLTDRYENVGISGLNYFAFAHQSGRQPAAPFWLNVHVYSCSLVLNSLPYAWRAVYNDDTDMCLQVLAGGWCTVLLNAFMIDKIQTMTVKGGNTQQLYQGDGRLKMARCLERLWPGVVTVDRRWQRPQHVVNWAKFKTALIRKPGVGLETTAADDYGVQLVFVGQED